MIPISIHDLPPELVEQIVLELDPLDVAAFAQTCTTFYTFVYDPSEQHLWRNLYLLQPRDDPRICVDPLGNPLPQPDWCSLLQRITRARSIVRDFTKYHPREIVEVLRTLLGLICNVPPASDIFSSQLSLNLVWVAALLRGGDFLDKLDQHLLSPDEQQLHAHLHTCFGLTTADYRRASLTRSRAFVYAMRNYKWDNDFGPFMMDGSGRVNWVHIQAIHHIMSMHVVPPQHSTEDTSQAFTIFPMSLPYCQSVIPPEVTLDEDEDWAGVTGLWQCSFCFCDHRELLSEYRRFRDINHC